MSRTHGGLAALVATTAALIAPAVFAAPAHATTTSGCTVTPYKPVAVAGTYPDGAKKIQYKVDITCDGGRTAHVTQQRWEQDKYSSDDNLGSTSWSVHFNSRTTVHETVTKPLPADGWGEGANYAEPYQRVHFYVVDDGNPPVTSKTTAWQYSAVASIRE